MKKNQLLSLKNIYAGYGNRGVLFDINLDFFDDRWVLLIGPNGSGKSTLLKVIAGILRQAKGRIYFENEKDISYCSPGKRVKYGIGFLRQTNNIFPALTIKENLELAGFFCNDNKFKNYLGLLFSIFPGLEKNINRRAGLLSGGVRQMLAIGMVLAREHKLILLDEPTAGLAPHAAKVILERIDVFRNKLLKEVQSTVIMVEHNYRYVINKVSRVIGMREGQIVFNSDTPEMMLEDKALMEKIFFK